MPTSYMVLDSGILLATALTETYTEHAKSLLRDFELKQIRLAAPNLFKYELVSVSRKWVHRQITTPEQATMILNRLLNVRITLHFNEALLKRAYELATKFNRPTAYDAQYLALAEHLSCDFWTTDERLYNAIKDDFQQIHWLGSIIV